MRTQSETHESNISGPFRKHISLGHLFLPGATATIHRIQSKSNKITTSLFKPSHNKTASEYFIKQLICSNWAVSWFPNLSHSVYLGGEGRF